MLTKKDRQQLLTDFKEVFATKEDIKTELKPISRDVKTIKKDVKQIKKDINSTLVYVDQENKKLKKRVEKIETHLGPSLSS